MIPKRKIEAYAKEYKATAIRVVSGGGVAFPVILFIYTAKQFAVSSVLKENLPNLYFTTEDVCRWCIFHNINYHIYISVPDRLSPWRRRQYHRIIRMI